MWCMYTHGVCLGHVLCVNVLHVCALCVCCVVCVLWCDVWCCVRAGEVTAFEGPVTSAFMGLWFRKNPKTVLLPLLEVSGQVAVTGADSACVSGFQGTGDSLWP